MFHSRSLDALLEWYHLFQDTVPWKWLRAISFDSCYLTERSWHLLVWVCTCSFCGLGCVVPVTQQGILFSNDSRDCPSTLLDTWPASWDLFLRLSKPPLLADALHAGTGTSLGWVLTIRRHFLSSSTADGWSEFQCQVKSRWVHFTLEILPNHLVRGRPHHCNQSFKLPDPTKGRGSVSISTLFRNFPRDNVPFIFVQLLQPLACLDKGTSIVGIDYSRSASACDESLQAPNENCCLELT